LLPLSRQKRKPFGADASNIDDDMRSVSRVVETISQSRADLFGDDDAKGESRLANLLSVEDGGLAYHGVSR